MGGITTVENFTYLGVNVDGNLNFEQFIGNTISKAQGRLLTLARVMKLLDLNTSLLIYKQTILQIVDNVSILVNSNTKRKIAKL